MIIKEKRIFSNSTFFNSRLYKKFLTVKRNSSQRHISKKKGFDDKRVELLLTSPRGIYSLKRKEKK